MTTAPDHITSTAPERIYLDLGDCAHLIKPEETFATYAQGEITWSEGNDSGVGIPYVRADLVPTPAASGAAPAGYEHQKAIQEGERIGASDAYFAARHEMLDTRDRRNVFDAGFDRGYAAALASREASPAPLTAGPVWYMRDNHKFRALTGGPEEMVDQCLEEFDAGYTCGMLCSKQRGIAVHASGKARREEFRLAALAALASPQVAPESDAALWRAHAAKLDALVTYCPTCCQGFTALPELTRDQVIFECGKTAGRVATPVQVAPTPLPRDATSADFATWLMGSITGGGITEEAVQKWWHDYCLECEATPVPLLVAPQDDARDAAKWRALPAYAERHQVNLVHLFRDIDDAMSLSTPAAKPTEPTLPTLPTQGEQSHD